MANMIKVSATVVSHIGIDRNQNKDNFYVNGRFLYEHDMDNVQVSLESNAERYVFAVCDNMERESLDGSMPISLIKELRKFHERDKTSQKNIYYQAEKLYESVDETSNLIYSMDLIHSKGKAEKNGMSVLYISGNKAAVLDTEGCRSYLLREGKLKSLTVDHKKTERLLKMGIITREQARDLASHFAPSEDQEEVQARKKEPFEIKEGDVFLLCTDGLADMVDEDRIYEMLDNRDTDVVSNLLVKEALKNGGEDNITVLSIRIENIDKNSKVENGLYPGISSERVSKVVKRGVNKLQRIVPLAIAICLVLALSIGTYKLWGVISDAIKPKIEVNKLKDDENTNKAESSNDQEIKSGSESQESEEGESQPSDPGNSEEQTGETVKYQVKKGDSLHSISIKFYNDSEKYTLIMEANNIENPDRIWEGQVLTIPQPIE